MAKATMKGNWNILKGKAKQRWGKLTNDDLDQIDGRRDELIGRIQKAYGKAKDEAEREVADFEKQ
jgi:uncharacterized protein YjbJ (UPF0337 family)